MDCASAEAKNRDLFKGKEYYGVDINKSLIDKAREQYHSDPTSFFIHDDVLNFKGSVKNKFFDLVVCTHTLAHIPNFKKHISLKNLVERVKVHGSFILECSVFELEYLKKIENMFTFVLKYPYRGIFSRGYETLLQWIYNTDVVGRLESNGRVTLYKYTKYFVFPASYFLSLFDRVFFNENLLVHFIKKK